MYTIIDLIDRLSEIEIQAYKLYLSISENIKVENSLKIMTKVFSNQEKKHLLVYEKLKEDLSSYDDIEIQFSTYDRVSTLIFEFSKVGREGDIRDVKELLKFVLTFEKENLALLLSIQGLFVKLQKDIETTNYIILSEIIKDEQQHVKLIEDILERNTIN